MEIRYLLDENLRGPLWRAIQRHNAAGGLPIDAERVGEPPDLPLGTLDPLLLEWCQREGRILVSFDHVTLPGHLGERLAEGGHSPGIFLIRMGSPLRDLLESLELAAHAGDPADYRDRVTYLP